MSQEMAQMVRHYENLVQRYDNYMQRSIAIQQEQKDVSIALLKNVEKITDNMALHQNELAGVASGLTNDRDIIKATALTTQDTNDKVTNIDERLLKWLMYAVLALLLVVGGISISRIIGSFFGFDF